MKCVMFVVVFLTTTAFSGEAERIEYKRDTDINDVIHGIQDVILDLHDGANTSDVIPKVEHVIDLANAVDCGADEGVDQAEINATIDRVIDAIRNHNKTDSLEAHATELNRAFYLWAGMADYLMDIQGGAEQDSGCQVIAAIVAIGKVIRDKLIDLGETVVSFHIDDISDQPESDRTKRFFCIGASYKEYCFGFGWD